MLFIRPICLRDEPRLREVPKLTCYRFSRERGSAKHTCVLDLLGLSDRAIFE